MPAALPIHWFLSSVVMQPVSWPIITSACASSIATRILRSIANERVNSRSEMMWRKPKPQQSYQVE